MLAMHGVSAYGQDAEDIYNIDILGSSVADSVKALARQTGHTVMFQSDDVNNVETQPLVGRYTLKQALQLLLKGTPLSGSLIGRNFIAIVRNEPEASENDTMNNKSTKRGIIAGIITAMFGASDVANAQSDISTKVIEEVIVTAQKHSENLQDVPIAITAFSGEQLDSFGANSTQDLQYSTPGLVFSNSSATAQPYLRGVGTRISLNGLEPSIATYVDNRYVGHATATIFDFADVERIEILKGPQGTLYGRNATGGAIRVITKSVTNELGGEVTAGIGNYNHRRLSGTVNVPFTEDFAARFSGLVKRRDGYADNLSPDGTPELDDQDLEAYRAKFRWDATERVAANLSLSYSKFDDTAGNDQVDLSPPGLNAGIAVGGISGSAKNPDAVATSVDKNNKGEDFSAELKFDVDFDNFDLVSISTFTDFDLMFVSDGEGTSSAVIDGFLSDSYRSYSQEFQLISDRGESYEWQLGTYLYQSDTNFETIIDATDTGAPSLISVGKQSTKTNAYAFFGQVKWDIYDNWALTLGGRWSYEKKEVSGRASTTIATTVTPGLPFDEDATFDEFTPSAVLQYEFEDALVYLKYARGFKSGGFNYPAAGKTILDPEILDMLELGFKGEYFAKQLRLNTSLYYYDYKDLQVARASSQTGVNTTENAADSTILGFDLDLTWLATNSLTVISGLNILDTEYKNYGDASAQVFNASLSGNPNQPGISSVPFDASGHSLLRAPDWSAFVSLQYDFRVGHAAVPAVLTYSYKDDYDFDFIADPSSKSLRQSAYGLLNARVSYQPDYADWEVALWINNLQDKLYFSDRSANAAGIRGSFGAPRTFGVNFTYNF
ncbi:TonB-dependent receptor [Zhongshania marina]|uniref:TonB-dependent receptor n=1 Tax=Zhongshania marina TaxID=2304603 RepID=A0ABX9W5S7_9GAMM|nr:TonB-dependent receptor [Zhongshania marina]